MPIRSRSVSRPGRPVTRQCSSIRPGRSGRRPGLGSYPGRDRTATGPLVRRLTVRAEGTFRGRLPSFAEVRALAEAFGTAVGRGSRHDAPGRPRPGGALHEHGDPRLRRPPARAPCGSRSPWGRRHRDHLRGRGAGLRSPHRRPGALARTARGRTGGARPGPGPGPEHVGRLRAGRRPEPRHPHGLDRGARRPPRPEPDATGAARHRRSRREGPARRRSGARPQGLRISWAALYDPPGWGPPERTWIRPSNGMAVRPWRGVGIGARALHRLVAAS